MFPVLVDLFCIKFQKSQGGTLLLNTSEERAMIEVFEVSFTIVLNDIIGLPYTSNYIFNAKFRIF